MVGGAVVHPPKELRSEIQGLRAVAVLTVAVFHIWPDWLSGGYVGVDVFFVISGFLITQLLVREAEREGGLDLGRFYLRRARRLLPAATLVLVAIAAATPAVLPASQWKDVALDVLAGFFYVENWRLAAQAADYFASESAPSPVQHYWSLSVEEQFYIFWPALILGGLVFGRALGLSLRAGLCVVFAIAGGLSLGASVLAAASDPASGYFTTHTRVWELALGGLLAVAAPSLNEGVRRFCGFAGLAAILSAAVLFTPETPFPGYAALLPAVGSALVIVSGKSAAAISAYSALKIRPLQFLGDASYSIYLWHWPLIVFFQAATGEAPDLVSGAAILLATIGLSAWSKRAVEDRFRHPGTGRPAFIPRAAAFAAFAAAPIAASAAVFAAAHLSTGRAVAAAQIHNYPGARAVYENAPVPKVEHFMPPMADVRNDNSAMEGCRVKSGDVEPLPCRFGDAAGKFKIFLIGDSHAGQWKPAFAATAEKLGWNAASYTKDACPLMVVPLEKRNKPDRPAIECFEWGKRLRAIIASEKPNIVIMSHRGHQKIFSITGRSPSWSEVLIRLWREIEGHGAKVVLIADTPAWRKDPDQCLMQDPDCAAPYETVRRVDPMREAQPMHLSVALVDFSDIICPDSVCPAVIGNVIVWRDRHHLTRTFVETMADIFETRIVAASMEAPQLETAASTN